MTVTTTDTMIATTRPRPKPTRANRLLGIVAVGAAAMVLSGCIKLDADMKIAKNDTFSGSFVVAVDARAFAALGLTKDALKAQFEESLKSEPMPKGVKGTSKIYDKGNWVGTQAAIAESPLSAMGALLASGDQLAASSGADAGANKFDVKHVGGKIVVDGTMDLKSLAPNSSSTKPGDPDFSAILKQYKPEIRIKITFPGKVTKSNGKISGNTVVWTPKIGELNPLTAEANDK